MQPSRGGQAGCFVIGRRVDMLHAHRFDLGSSPDRLRYVMNAHVEMVVQVVFEHVDAPSRELLGLHSLRISEAQSSASLSSNRDTKT